jgi:hypothetical protein
MLGPELLPLRLCRRKCRMEGIDDAMQPMPVSIFEHRTVCATQTLYEFSKEDKQRKEEKYSHCKSVPPSYLLMYGMRKIVMIDALL